MTNQLKDIECTLCRFAGSKFELLFHECNTIENNKEVAEATSKVMDKFSDAVKNLKDR